MGTGKVFSTKPRRWFASALKRAGIKDFVWHSLRHTFCSRLVAAGVPLVAVSELAGHKTIQMTMRYSHFAPGRLSSDLEVLCRPTGTTTDTDAPSAVVKVQ